MWYYIEIQIKSTPVEIPEPTPGATEIPITAVLDNTTTDGSIDGVDFSVNPCTGKCPSGMCQADPSVGKECSMKILSSSSVRYRSRREVHRCRS